MNIKYFLLHIFNSDITINVPVIRPNWTIEPYWPNCVSVKLRSFFILFDDALGTPPSEQLKKWINQNIPNINKRTQRDKRISPSWSFDDIIFYFFSSVDMFFFFFLFFFNFFILFFYFELKGFFRLCFLCFFI